MTSRSSRRVDRVVRVGPPREREVRRRRAVERAEPPQPGGPSRSGFAPASSSSARAPSSRARARSTKRSSFTAAMEYEDRVRISTPEGVDVELDAGRDRLALHRRDLRLHDPVLARARRRPAARRAGGDPGLGWRGSRSLFFLVFFGYDVLFEVRAHGPHAGQARDRAARGAHRRHAGHVRAELPCATSCGSSTSCPRCTRSGCSRSSSRARTSGSATWPPARWSCATAPAGCAARRPRRASPARSPTAGTSAPSRPATSAPSAASSTAARRWPAARARSSPASSSSGCARWSPARPRASRPRSSSSGSRRPRVKLA